ncbi:MAG TPA: hypothetical protein VG675_10475 [Bryobacteraceae bacterium]|nr:hypothetical protein [Bryobacteraceae bacterium]
MKDKKEQTAAARGAAMLPNDENQSALSERHAPRKATFKENIALTVKILLGFGVLGAVLWAIELLTSAA